MKTLVTYDSYFINTQKVTEAVAEGLEHAGFQVMFERIYQVDFNAISDIDLLVVGSPTHNQGMPRPVKSVLKKLPKGTAVKKQIPITLNANISPLGLISANMASCIPATTKNIRPKSALKDKTDARTLSST